MLTAPHLNYALLAPILIVLGGALLGVLVESFVGKAYRSRLQVSIALLAVVAAFVQLIQVRTQTSNTAAVNSVSMDSAGIYIQLIILALSFVGLLMIADTDNFTAQASSIPGSTEEASAIAAGRQQTEVFPLTLFAIAGMLLFPVATDFITLFVALEVLSLPLYLMAGLSRRRRLLSQEAALKYFLLGAFSSAFFLFGAAFLYGYSGSLSLAGIADGIHSSGANSVFLLIGLIFVSVGLLFKVGAVPFHSWTPDVYQGAPTPITGFMAACTKAAAFGAMLRIFYVGFNDAQWSWRIIFSTIAVITMVFGAIAAIVQRDVKRTLAFSSITHAGFIMISVIALSHDGLSAALFYFIAYGFATLGAFAIITLVRDSSGEITDLNRWSGLGKRSPLVAGAFSLFLLSFGGIPLTAGFIGKFTVFTASYNAGNINLVVFGVLTSAVALFFYLKIILTLFFGEVKNDTLTVVIPSILTRLAIAICVAVTIVLGVYPSIILNSAQTFATFIR